MLMIVAIILKQPSSNADSTEQSLVEFEVDDDTYVETRETHSSLEREMTIKAFTESTIHAFLYVISYIRCSMLTQ